MNFHKKANTSPAVNKALAKKIKTAHLVLLIGLSSSIDLGPELV